MPDTPVFTVFIINFNPLNTKPQTSKMEEPANPKIRK